MHSPCSSPAPLSFSCQRLMLVSSTTRPVMRCVWNFPSVYSGLAFATTSLVIHEMAPILLMAFTSLSSLYTLYNHGRMHPLVQNATVIKGVPAETRAAKVRKRSCSKYKCCSACCIVNIFI